MFNMSIVSVRVLGGAQDSRLQQQFLETRLQNPGEIIPLKVGWDLGINRFVLNINRFILFMSFLFCLCCSMYLVHFVISFSVLYCIYFSALFSPPLYCLQCSWMQAISSNCKWVYDGTKKKIIDLKGTKKSYTLKTLLNESI